MANEIPTVLVPRFDIDPTYTPLYMHRLTGLVPVDSKGVDIDFERLRICSPQRDDCYYLELSEDRKVVSRTFTKAEVVWRQT